MTHDTIDPLAILEACIENDMDECKFVFTDWNDEGEVVLDCFKIKLIIEELRTNPEAVCERGRKKGWLE